MLFKGSKKTKCVNTHKGGAMRRQKGFTLPEIILIVGVLAIISGMAFPDIALFFQKQQVEQEKLAMADIQKAMDAYARECLRLPELEDNPTRANCRDAAGGGLTWAEALSSFSNMSAESFANDVWGTPRKYTHAVDQRQYREGPVDFHYATVRSIGGNQCDDTGTANSNPNPPCVVNGQSATAAQKAANREAYIANGDPDDDYENDWSPVANYGSFQPEGDDLVAKYADNQRKVQAQDETIKRLERIVDALDRYAQGRFNEQMLDPGSSCLSERIYYPPSRATEYVAHSNPNNPETGCDSLGTSLAGRYGSKVLDDVRLIRNDATSFVNTQTGTEATRLTNMRTLMRILGLPEDHCCNALTGEPFYYYSSPGAPVGGTCNFPTKPPYYPPKVSISAIDVRVGGSCQ